jgi:hypothetical protein
MYYGRHGAPKAGTALLGFEAWRIDFEFFIKYGKYGKYGEYGEYGEFLAYGAEFGYRSNSCSSSACGLV